MRTFLPVTIPVLINLQTLIDEQKCYETVRQLRWSEGVACSKCGAKSVVKRGFDETQPHRQRYQCQTCHARFDDLSDTIFARHHQPLQTWILCLYLMGLNLSTHQIAAELDLNKDDAQQMTSQLRACIVKKKPEVILEGEVELDELYLIAGFKGQPVEVKKRGDWVVQDG
ncbi:MAG: transposase [Chroococcidiopsidaceae cyanobacterium CP_BM_RX_35]|nr:transposase [Chroococcidiopsidaceae cyanobacterium CP_BM_RX_35]